MCFSVNVDVNIKSLANRFNAAILSQELINEVDIKANVIGPKKTDKLLGIVSEDNQFKIKILLWSLTPSWSKDYPVRWSTYNARMERINKGVNQKIYDVPTFKDAFRKNQFCLIPIVGAIESCYWGDTKGKLVSFEKKDDTSFFVVGIWSQWVDKKTGEVKETCTMLTDDPYKYFFDHGHDRSVFSIDDRKFEEFLFDKNRNYKKSFEFIRENRISHEWKTTIKRTMKEGWENRVPSENEILEIKKTVWG